MLSNGRLPLDSDPRILATLVLRSRWRSGAILDVIGWLAGRDLNSCFRKGTISTWRIAFSSPEERVTSEAW